MAEAGIARWSPEQPALGSVNAVLTARSRAHFTKDFPGPLSIKMVLQGRVAWKLGSRHIWVDDSSFLVLHEGETYSMDFEFPQPVITCCAFFAHGFVESVSADLCCPTNQRLDCASKQNSLSFLTFLHPHSPELVNLMTGLRKQILRGVSDLVLDEQFLALALQLLSHHEETQRQMGRIGAARAATRQELFTRVARGREFLHTEGFGRVRLAEAARAACLSPFHFHRTFRQAFGTSPSRYVNELRLTRAAQLLGKGVPVTDTCFQVGFQSVGSFSLLFRKHFGVPPSSLHR